jgi:hypothetical protein
LNNYGKGTIGRRQFAGAKGQCDLPLSWGESDRNLVAKVLAKLFQILGGVFRCSLLRVIGFSLLWRTDVDTDPAFDYPDYMIKIVR